MPEQTHRIRDPRRRTTTALVIAPALALLAPLPSPLAPSARAQEIGDASRLTGVERIAVRATASWDELITTSAGGATEDQFEEALLTGFLEALAGADPGPEIAEAAPEFVLCHVDTFYDRGLIVYSVRVSHHRTDADGRPVITWLHSSVGSYTAQQLHVIWTLGDQCAEAYLEDWAEANR